MSTKTVADSFDLVPGATGLAKVWNGVKRFAAAISEGRDAEFAYRSLVSRGVAPDRAVQLVLTNVLKREESHTPRA